ncbi:YihY/virulence factor BrkB family protein [Angustibacter sp. McL0619]|uniref:YihY/virulence factor BrkB family protein n=1 Tax=Angustibacter sp. McL0619 TaxID=3415676 RepID=UPI003CEC5325
MKELLARLQASHPYRSWTRYGNARGNLLAGGVTFVGFFSVIPVLILAFSVFGFVLRDHPQLFDRVVAYISDTLPGIVKDAEHPEGLLDATNPPTPDLLTIAGLVSVVTLVFAGLGWVNAIREGTRAMFDQPRQTGNIAFRKMRDLGLLALLGVPVLASGVLSLVVTGATSWAMDRVGVDSGSTSAQVLVRVLGVLVVLVADFILMVIILRLMSGLTLSRRDVGQGALIGAVGMGVLKLGSGLLLASASRKPVLASFAVIIGLLLLINLISRVVLLSAAWAATGLQDRGRLGTGTPVEPLPRRAGPREAMLPSFGQRSADRTSLAAGAVLGVSALVVARSVRHGLRAAVGAVRGR